MRNVLAVILSLMLTFQNCTGDEFLNAPCNSDCTTITGKFTTEDGNTPIKNVGLKLKWGIDSSPGTIGFERDPRKIATAKTDENGNYVIVFYALDEELSKGSFAVEFQVPDQSYITRPDHSYFQFSGLKKRDTIIARNYHIPKKGGIINVKINNPQDIQGDDHLLCSVSFKFNDLTKSIHSNAGQLYSKHGSEATYNTAANQYSYIRITRKINEQYFNSLDSIYIPMNKAILYEINF